MTFSADSFNIKHVHVVTIANQGCHIPFRDRVQGPSELGKLSTFCEIGKNCTPFK